MHEKGSPRIGILADDLTSAADGAGPFVRRGLTASVGRWRPPPCSRADAVAVDLGTRSLPVRDAIARVEQATAALAGAEILYKTVDSTLRGHVRAEIGAALEASGRSRVVFAPAFPEAARITRDGVQYVDGVPVDRSAYAADPTHPARTARLSELVPSVVGDAIILDAETQEELDNRVASIGAPEDVLWIGSPGMAIALSRKVGAIPVTAPFVSVQGDVLVVVGSANAVSHVQADRVGDVPGITVLKTPSERVANARQTLSKLAADAVAAIKTGRYGSVVATGGDTIAAILDGLGITVFDLTGEVEPGIPTARATHRGRALALAMKAGGFGSPDALLRAARRLASSQEVAS